MRSRYSSSPLASDWCGGFRNQSKHARQTRTSLASAIMSEIISSSLENAPVFNTREVVKVYDVGEV